MILLIALLSSATVLLAYLITIRRAIAQVKTIYPVSLEQEKTLVESGFSRVSVIVPAYNEEDNIERCVRSILESSCLSTEHLEVWVIDDQSTDQTWAILKRLKDELNDPRLNILAGKSRPIDHYWTGKNWACYQAAQQATGEFFFFIDADMRLKPGAIAAVIHTALTEKVDLLTCIPTIVCGSWVEYVVQPLIFINLLVTFNSKIVKDPTTQTTYALGPFLLFRASAYRAIGGHEAIAGVVAEDVTFARLVKKNGFALLHAVGPSLASLRMYRSLSALWEGWTKVLYVGANRSVFAMGMLVFAMVTAYITPWVGLAIALVQFVQPWGFWYGVQLGLVALTIFLQYRVRLIGSSALGTTARYWWLQGVGGLLISTMAIASIIKAETGWGWTWRGRSLKPPK